MAADPTPDSEDQDAEAEGSDEALHHEALERFDTIIQAEQEERALSLRDRRFVTISGAQWEGDWAEQFENSIMVEVNKTAAGVEKIIADYRANRVTVNFRCADDDADDDTAETLNGMFRADVYASKGQQAFDMAFEEAAQGGRGAFRLANDYEDEYDPDNDRQRIRFIAIPDADQCVFWDPNAKLYDKSDAKYCFVLTAMAREAYEDKYDEDTSNWPTGLYKTWYEWFTPVVVYIAEYYEVREKEGLLKVFQNVATGEERREWAADLTPEEAKDLETQGWKLTRTRRGKRCTVWKTVLSGSGILEAPRQIAGRCIPVVPVYGKRWFIDNMERARGHVRLAVDPQRIYNAQISKLTETAATAPQERPIFTPEQVAGHEQSWAEANIKRAPYALVNPITGIDGNPLPAGPVAKVEAPQLSPVLAGLIQITASDIADLTSADDGADEVKANVSADAMDIAATRTDAKAEIYLDNFRQSMQRCGEIYLSMAKEVYVEEGRAVPTLSADGKDHAHAVLNQAVADDKGYRIQNDISRGRYNVIADVSETTKTRRDKTVKTLVNVATIAQQADPELAAAALNTAVMNMDGEGMHDLQDWIRSRLVSQGVVKPNDEEKAQLEQAQQQPQQPGPDEQLAMAAASKEAALADKARADTELSKAKTVQTLADAARMHADAARAGVDHHVDMLGKVKAMLEPSQTPGGAA